VVELRYLGVLSIEIGNQNEFIRAHTFSDVFKHINKCYGKHIAKLAKRMVITLNAVDIRLLNGIKTQLSDNDIISFYPPAAGG